MLRNHFMLVIRQLRKNKFYSFINIFGLAGSTAVSVLMFLYAYQVLTYDSFHTKFENIYLLYRDRPSPTGPLTIPETWNPLLEETMNAFPEVVGGTRMFAGGNTWMQHEEKLYDEQMTWADSGFFKVFDFDFVAGNPETALSARNNLVISQALATRLFGSADPIGKTVRLFFNTDYVVSAVVGAFPPNSSIQFNAIVPLHDDIPFVKQSGWNESYTTTFVVLKDGIDPKTLQSKLGVLMEKFISPSERGTFMLLPLADYNDGFSDQRKYAMMLLGIAFGILVLAAINFTNLASAQSFTRMKEVGMRKALGASRLKVILQFLSESMVLSFVSLAIGIVFAQLLLPAFSELVGMQLELDIITKPLVALSLILLAVFTGFASGFYPALFASGFQPAMVLKGLGGSHTRGGFLRTALLTFQFTIAIFLISAVIIILQQVNHMKSKDLNFEKDNVMAMRVSPRDYADREAANRAINLFNNNLETVPQVVSVARSGVIPGNYSGSFSLFVAEGAETADPFDWRVAFVDANYFDTYRIPFLEGRNFIHNSQTDRRTAVIINEAALRAMGWSTAAGKKLKFPQGDGFLEIIGVTKDFDYGSAANGVEPVVHVYDGEESAGYQFLSIQLQPGTHQAAIASIGEQWKTINPDRSFEYFFPSDRFKDLYNTEENIASIISSAAVLAIFIACLGLFALASFNMAQRQKEVAVRKVMGASVLQLALMFLKKYLVMVVVSLLISVPLTYYFGEQWLTDFAYRISISPMVIVVAGGICGLIAIVTIGLKSVRTAGANPVNSLKYE